MRQADPDAGAVDRGDDRLAQLGEEMRVAVADQLGDVGVAVAEFFVDGSRATQVRARAESLAGTGQHDHPHRGVGFGAVDACVEAP